MLNGENIFYAYFSLFKSILFHWIGGVIMTKKKSQKYSMEWNPLLFISLLKSISFICEWSWSTSLDCESKEVVIVRSNWTQILNTFLKTTIFIGKAEISIVYNVNSVRKLNEPVVLNGFNRIKRILPYSCQFIQIISNWESYKP